jgi:hypothetical protein
VLDAREKKTDLKKGEAEGVAAEYLAAVEKVAAAVDAA